MIELITRVSVAESSLAASLGAASRRAAGESGRRLKRLSVAKKRLARELASGASGIRGASRRAPLMAGLGEMLDWLDSSLLFMVAAIESGMEEPLLADALSEHERFKWNNLVLSLVPVIRKDFPEGVRVLVAAQRGKRAIESFLELAGPIEGLFSLKAAEPAWKERLLVVGEVPDEITSSLGEECLVEKTDAKDAIARIRERYYGAIIAVDELSDIKATDLCARAAKVFPGIEERFLYLYGAGKGPGPAKAPRLPMSSSAVEIIEAVGRIFDR